MLILYHCLFFLFSVNICHASPKNNYSDTAVFPLTLKKAIELALSQNRHLLFSANSIESGKVSVEYARSAFDLKLTPTSSAGITNGDSDIRTGIRLSRKLFSGQVLSVTPEVGRSEDDYSARVSMGLTVPLMRGVGEEANLTAIKSSEFNLRSARRNDYISRVNTVLTTVSYVYRIIELKDLICLYQKQIISLEDYATGLKRKKKVGLATPMDVFRAEILLKDTEDTLSSTSNLISSTTENLKSLLSLTPETKIEVSAPKNNSPIDISLGEAIETALTKRIEIEHAMDVLNERLRESLVAENNLLPKLDLAIDYERSNTTDQIEQLLNMDKDIFTVKLVSSTDWARSSEKAVFQNSQINIRNAKLDMASKKDEIVSEVKLYFRTLEDNLERIKIRKELIDTARGKLKLSVIKYKYEMADNFDMIEAKKEITQAKANLLAVQAEYIVGLYRFRAAMGTLIDRK